MLATSSSRRSIGRRGAWSVIALWLAAALAAGWLGSNLGDHTSDEDRAFLPQDGSAARFDEMLSRLVPADQRHDSVIVVLESRDRLDSSEIEDLRRLGAELRGDSRLSVVGIEEPVVAPDGHLAFLPISVQVDDDELATVIHAIRHAARGGLVGDSSAVMVTGAAAAEADLGTGDVDLWLLLVSAGIVAVILAVAYRSLVLWILPVAVGIISVVVSQGLTAAMALTPASVTELAASISTVVVFGVSTDYALLLLNRHRSLKSQPHAPDITAVSAARQVRTPVMVSAGIIALVVLTLGVSPVPGMRALGPVLAMGVVTAAAASLTLLPAVLMVLPKSARARRATPLPGSAGTRWDRLAERTTKRPALALVAAGTILGLATLGGLNWHSSADPLSQIPDAAESKRGALALRDHMGTNSDAAVEVILSAQTRQGESHRIVAKARDLGAKARLRDESTVRDRPILSIQIDRAPFSPEWKRDLERLTKAVSDADPRAVVGGSAVEANEREDASLRQLWLVSPVVLAALTGLLAVWLRSVWASCVIVVSSCLSCVAAWGAMSMLSPTLSDSSSASVEVLLFGFLFLISFGVDYVVFLIDSIRDAPEGTHRARVAHGLSNSGPVITAAGAVLAATFATLLLLPEANVRQVGLLVAFGVVVDTVVVRVLFVPAMLCLLPGRWSRVRQPEQMAKLEHPQRLRVT